MRTRFDEQLDNLNQEMVSMGMLCENAIAKTTTALLSCDVLLAGKLPDLLTQINQKEREIENICIRLLLHQQPVAKDLRTVSAALKMVTDMERIGCQSADIAEIITMGNITRIDEELQLKNMAAAVTRMVGDSMDAFVKKDMQIAESVIKYDDVVDGYFNDVKKYLIEQLKDTAYSSEAILDLLMIAKYFERIGDHAAIIANWVRFAITGVLETKD